MFECNMDIVQQNEFIIDHKCRNEPCKDRDTVFIETVVMIWEILGILILCTLYRFTKLPHSSYHSYYNIANCHNTESANDVAARVVLCQGYFV